MQLIFKLLKQIAKETLEYLSSLSTNKIILPGRILIVFNLMRTARSIRAEAFLTINGPYWLFPIVEAQKSKSNDFREKFYLLVSSIIHEMEHAASTDESIQDAFSDNEHVTTFAEYLSVPMFVSCRHETEYLPTIKDYLISHEEGKNFSHAVAFYMSLIIFVDYIRSKAEFSHIPELTNFPKLDINQQFEFLINLRKYMKKQKKDFLRFALECRELIYRSGNLERYKDMFIRAQNNLGLVQIEI